MRLLILTIGLLLSGAVNGQNMKPLTPEERRVIVDKGTEAPLRADIMTTARRAYTTAANAARRCTVPPTSSTRGAAGPVSMTRFRAP